MHEALHLLLSTGVVDHLLTFYSPTQTNFLPYQEEAEEGDAAANLAELEIKRGGAVLWGMLFYWKVVVILGDLVVGLPYGPKKDRISR